MHCKVLAGVRMARLVGRSRMLEGQNRRAAIVIAKTSRCAAWRIIFSSTGCGLPVASRTISLPSPCIRSQADLARPAARKVIKGGRRLSLRTREVLLA